MSKASKQISLKNIFLGLQDSMRARLSLNRRTLHHPVAKGDASELEWIELLSTYLPARYKVDKAFVIDHRGQISEQIDIVIFDRHFSPFLFRQNGQTFVPAESVYAILEVKQELNNYYIDYAAKKIASVRRLTRTSAPIIDCGIARDPRPLPHILGGFVSLAGNVTSACEEKLLSLKTLRRIDLGCSLESQSFYVDYSKPIIQKSTTDNSLVFFFLKLLAQLQKAGTVPPMEVDKYAASL